MCYKHEVTCKKWWTHLVSETHVVILICKQPIWQEFEPPHYIDIRIKWNISASLGHKRPPAFFMMSSGESFQSCLPRLTYSTQMAQEYWSGSTLDHFFNSKQDMHHIIIFWQPDVVGIAIAQQSNPQSDEIIHSNQYRHIGDFLLLSGGVLPFPSEWKWPKMLLSQVDMEHTG